MSVSISCDRCGAAIAKADLDARRALAVSGKHFCPACKGPIVELIKKRKAAAAASARKTPLAQRAAKAREKVARRSGAKPAAGPGRGKKTPSGARRRRAAPEKAGAGKGKLIAIGGTVGAAIIALAAYVAFFSGGGPEVAPEVVSPAPASQGAGPGNVTTEPDTSAAERQAELEANQRKALEKYRARFEEVRDDADGVLALLDDLHFFGRGGLVSSVGGEAATLSSEASARRDELAVELLQETIEKSSELQEAKSFGQAHQLWHDAPELIEAKPELSNRWRNERTRAREYADAAQLWGKLVDKVKKYVKQRDYAIAESIVMENVPEDFKTKFPSIWEERQKLLGRLDNEQVAAEELVSEVHQKQKEAERLKRFHELEKIRKVKWDNLLELTSWVPLLSNSGDLENWFMTVDRHITERGADPFPWKNIEVGGKRMLSADASERDDALFIGMNGNRWLDWVLECDVQVLAGELEFQARTEILGFYGMSRVERAASESLTFSADESKDWRELRVEVRGNLVRFIIDGEEVKVDRDVQHERGGFRFELKPTGIANIRNPRVKWISTLESDRDGTSEFADPDELQPEE